MVFRSFRQSAAADITRATKAAAGDVFWEISP